MTATQKPKIKKAQTSLHLGESLIWYKVFMHTLGPVEIHCGEECASGLALRYSGQAKDNLFEFGAHKG